MRALPFISIGALRLWGGSAALCFIRAPLQLPCCCCCIWIGHAIASAPPDAAITPGTGSAADNLRRNRPLRFLPGASTEGIATIFWRPYEKTDRLVLTPLRTRKVQTPVRIASRSCGDFGRSATAKTGRPGPGHGWEQVAPLPGDHGPTSGTVESRRTSGGSGSWRLIQYAFHRRANMGGQNTRAAGALQTLSRRSAAAASKPTTVYLDFAMDRAGTVLDFRIERSAGYALLDEEVTALIPACRAAACATEASRWRAP